jgi:hypothetical protein
MAMLHRLLLRLEAQPVILSRRWLRASRGAAGVVLVLLLKGMETWTPAMQRVLASGAGTQRHREGSHRKPAGIMRDEVGMWCRCEMMGHGMLSVAEVFLYASFNTASSRKTTQVQ